MKLLKDIAGRLFAVWAILIFVPTMLIVFLPIVCALLWKDPKRTAIFQKIARLWMRIFFFLTGIRLRMKGKEYFKKGEAYIVICNHNSFMDIPLTTPFIPGPNKTIAKKEMASVPIFGVIYKIGSVLVDRKSEESRRASLTHMKEVLEVGLHMCIYPEGTRNKTSQPIQPFHNGAFRLASDTGKSIMPAVIFNTAKVLPAGKGFYFWPVKIRMEFLPPIAPEGQTVDQLKHEAFEKMTNYYVANK